MYSILWTYEVDRCGDIAIEGPFETKDEAILAAKSLQEQEEFDIEEDMVYLIGPNHTFVPLSINDLI